MKNLIFVTRECQDFENDDIPKELNNICVIPTFGMAGMHYYYLVDFYKKKIICWTVDTCLMLDYLENMLKDDENIDYLPWNQQTVGELLESYFFPHSITRLDNKLYISYFAGNHILELNMDNDEFDLIYQKDRPTRLYSSTNALVNGEIYYTSWDIRDTFKRVKSGYKDFIDLEIGKYNIRTKEFQTLNTFKGTDDIHETKLSKDGNFIMSLEMCQEPKMKYPKDLHHADPEIMREILKNRLIDSHLFVNDLRNKTVNQMLISNCPAHMVRDVYDKDTYYVLEHNNSMISHGVLCFGNAAINKIRIVDGKPELIERYDGKDHFRSPSLAITKYKDKQYIVCPGYPKQVHLIDVDTMQLAKKISVSKKIQDMDFSDGPIAYMNPIKDRTPYTVNTNDNTPYLYLSNLLGLTIYDYEEDKKVTSIFYNFNKKPYISCGHANVFNIYD